jgi:hypothetical protein
LPKSSAVAQMRCGQIRQLGMHWRTGNGESTPCNVRIEDWSGFGLRVQRQRVTVATSCERLWVGGEPVVVDVVSDLEPRAPEPWVPV